MDLDSKLMIHNRRLGSIEEVLGRVKSMLGMVDAPADGQVAAAPSNPIEAVLAVKHELEDAMPEIRKLIQDGHGMMDDLRNLMEAFKPTFEYVQAQIAADEARKANRAAAVAAGEHVEEATSEPAEATGTPARAPDHARPQENAVDYPGAQTS